MSHTTFPKSLLISCESTKRLEFKKNVEIFCLCFYTSMYMWKFLFRSVLLQELEEKWDILNVCRLTRCFIPKNRFNMHVLMYQCSFQIELFYTLFAIVCQLLDGMCMALGGRAAEALIFKTITSGIYASRCITDCACYRDSQI